MSVAISWANKMQLAKCDIMVGFLISSHILLPSQQTLLDYTHHIKATNGFSSEVDVQLCQAANLKSCKLIDQYVILLLDEMYIKEGLVYDKHTGELIGFTYLGDINSHLLSLEQ